MSREELLSLQTILVKQYQDLTTLIDFTKSKILDEQFGPVYHANNNSKMNTKSRHRHHHLTHSKRML